MRTPGPMTRSQDRDANAAATKDDLLANFLASSFFAEDEATPVVDKLLQHPTSSEERALLLSYAAEEDSHARILDAELTRRKLPKGQPFWIQKVFRKISARTTLLIQFYHVEIIAGCFYGAMAARLHDHAARDLLRRHRPVETAGDDLDVIELDQQRRSRADLPEHLLDPERLSFR